MFGQPPAKKKSPDLVALELSAGPSLAEEESPLPLEGGESPPADPEAELPVEERLASLESRLAALEKSFK